MQIHDCDRLPFRFTYYEIRSIIKKQSMFENRCKSNTNTVDNNLQLSDFRELSQISTWISQFPVGSQHPHEKNVTALISQCHGVYYNI